MRRVRVFGIGMAAALVVALGTACDPPVPRLTLVVDAAGTAPDAEPGDSVCATEAGTCTLSAAIDEANAVGRAAIVVPPGDYDVHGETVTGAIWINDREPVRGVQLTGLVTVAAGGALVVDGVWSNYSSLVPPPTGPLRFRADGLLVLRAVQLAWASATDSLVHVGPTGAAVLDTSFLGTSFATKAVVANEGRLWLRYSWLMNIVPEADAYALLTTGAGVSSTTTSAIAGQGVGAFPTLPQRGCGGTLPVSAGYNADGDGTCGLTGTGDRVSDSPLSRTSSFGALDYDVVATSPLVDAVPVGTQGCGSEPWGDWYEQTRPADGNGDGQLACDIGPKELQGPGGSPLGGSAPPLGGRSAPAEPTTGRWGLGG